MLENSINKDSTILVVDDKPENLDVLIAYLQESDLRILVAQNGEEALDLALRFSPDLILLDVLMPPGIDGFETCRRLKARPETEGIPVIFMTALSETVDKVKGFQTGGVDYVTKPLQHEEVLARVNAHLTIQNQQRQLREVNASKDRFFSIIAHDLRGPLYSLRDISQTLLDHLDSNNLDALKEIIVLQHHATENLCKLLENLLTWSRIQRGNIEYKPQELDMGVICQYNLNLLAPSAEQKQITLSTTLPENIMVNADLNMLDTVMRNLLSNALKFTHPGGNIHVTLLDREQEVEVNVSDTGIGIDAKVIPKLFHIDEKYQRLGTAREKGTGLGLILCKELVEKHGGRIWVESEVKKGATFHFTLPKTTQESQS